MEADPIGLRATLDGEAYVKAVDAIGCEIEAGNVYQANLTYRMEMPIGRADPWTVYRETKDIPRGDRLQLVLSLIDELGSSATPGEIDDGYRRYERAAGSRAVNYREFYFTYYVWQAYQRTLHGGRKPEAEEN